ncbi:hypothetical protein GW590_14115 [Rahnella sp. SAP-1]|uniref:Haloacid dehalogenase n=1 Tax=Rouxiella aceris TaxID=2703884 RepID=A0A848MM72_9GAMM|nr:hypothetical protein [Rouxiella aceris]NMP27992.1 hypothetical protein [Rouxiella aceris]
MSLIDLALKIEEFSVISFDFFDTLFIRKLEEPESVFDLVGEKFKIDQFRALRKRAQQLAFVEMHNKNKKEISLDDIYNNFHELDEDKKHAVKAYELQLELDVICPNQEMIPVFLKAIELGKKVVITSDMYLTSHYFKESLSKYNLPQVPLFISADCDATKRDFGDIFDIVKNEMKVVAEQILHIGDNQLADVDKAQSKGLSAYHYQADSITQRKNVPISESIVNGLTDSRINSFSNGSGEQFAYQYGGPTLIGFSQWLKKITINDKIDALLYLARDGYMIKKYSDRSCKDDVSGPVEVYFKGSRTSFILSSINDTNFNEYIPYFLSGAYELSAHELLERIGVVPPAQHLLHALGFAENKAIKEISYDNIYNLLNSMKKDILKVCRANRRGLHQLLIDLNLPDNANIGLVDVGWKGTTQEAFENAIKPFFNYKVFGYYFCLISNTSSTKKSMLDSTTVGEETINKVYENRVAFELLFSAPHETIIGHVLSNEKVKFIEDERQDKARSFFAPLEKGMSEFFDIYDNLTFKIHHLPEDNVLIKPFVDYAISGMWKQNKYILTMQNFDAWSATKNKTFSPGQYI